MKWIFIGVGGKCEHCGGTDTVHRYEHRDTGEKTAVCDPCEQAGAEL